MGTSDPGNLSRADGGTSNSSWVATSTVSDQVKCTSWSSVVNQKVDESTAIVGDVKCNNWLENFNLDTYEGMKENTSSS